MIYNDYNSARGAKLVAKTHGMAIDDINRICGKDFSDLVQLSEIDSASGRAKWDSWVQNRKDRFEAWMADSDVHNEQVFPSFLRSIGVEYKQQFVQFYAEHETDSPSVVLREIHGDADDKMIADFPVDYELIPEQAMELARLRAQLFELVCPKPQGSIEADIEALRAAIKAASEYQKKQNVYYYLFGEDAVRSYVDGENIMYENEDYAIFKYDEEYNAVGDLLFEFHGWNNYAEISEAEYDKIKQKLPLFSDDDNEGEDSI